MQEPGVGSKEIAILLMEILGGVKEFATGVKENVRRVQEFGVPLQEIPGAV